MEIIKLEDVEFCYGNKKVFDEVNISIFENEFITIVGPNGAGKSTLIKIILGILKPTKGRVWVFGRDPREVGEIFGYIPQIGNFDIQFPITVEEVVLGGLIRSFGFISRSEKHRVFGILKELGMYEYRKEHFFSLSGGQQQRILLARALVSSPPILVLDEPASNIDVEGENIVFSILSNLKGKKTILVITHDTGFVDSITDRTICVNGGKVREHNTTPDEVMANLFGHSESARKVLHGGS